MKKKHPLSWFMERTELIIDAGIIFAIVAVVIILVVSVFLAPGHPAYLD